MEMSMYKFTKSSITLSVVIVMAALSLPVLAHHGTGISYDATKAFMIKGTVTEFRYANPHPQLYWYSVDEKGTVVRWSGEIASNPGALIKYGWGKKRAEAALQPGTRVTLTVFPSRAGGPVAVVNKIVNEKGEQVLCSFAPGATELSC
jgi:hypothetical protein